MVRKDNLDKQKWDFTDFPHIEREILKKFVNPSHRTSPSVDEIPKSFWIPVIDEKEEKGQHKVYHQLEERFPFVIGASDNLLEELKEELEKNFKSPLSKIDAELDKETNHPIDVQPSRIRDRTENLISKTSFWIPRKYREAIVGDIIADCHELRALGEGEWRIRIHVIWQVVWALVLLRPVAFMGALKRILSIK